MMQNSYEIQMSVSTNKVLLEHSLAHLFTSCLWPETHKAQSSAHLALCSLLPRDGRPAQAGTCGSSAATGPQDERARVPSGITESFPPTSGPVSQGQRSELGFGWTDACNTPHQGHGGRGSPSARPAPGHFLHHLNDSEWEAGAQQRGAVSTGATGTQARAATGPLVGQAAGRKHEEGKPRNR